MDKFSARIFGNSWNHRLVSISFWNSLFLKLIYSLFFFIFLFPIYADSISLKKKVWVREISGFTDRVPENCANFSQEIPIPSPLNSKKEWIAKEYFEYCIPFSLPPDISSPGISLGYVDNYYRVYLNGVFIASSEEMEELVYLYDKPLLLHPSSSLFQKENILILQVRKFSGSITGGGLYGGILEIAPYKKIYTESQVFNYYNFGKVILFISASILFFILYLSRPKEKEYFWFALFLIILTIYYFSKLEIRYDLGISIAWTKRVEFLSVTLILPSFIPFVFKLLRLSKKSWLLSFVSIGGIVFFLIFLFLETVQDLENFNYLYHLPFMISCIILSIIRILYEWKNKNKRTLPILLILSIPSAMSLLQVLNSRFGMFPMLSGIMISGDSILLLVISMAAYVGVDYYGLQKKLDSTIQKEENLRKTFQLYVPPRDIEKILNSFNEEGELSNTGTLEETTILFCDIREFTNFSEKMNPSEVVQFLNSYFKRFNRILVEHGGVIDKLIGDCIMARFDKGKEMYAISAALAMQEELESFNKARRRVHQKSVYNGIGISVGNVILGNIGSVNKMDFTVIGDSVNVASRLESMTKFYSVPILVTETFYRKTQKFVLYREIDKVLIKGKKKPTVVYQPLSLISEDWKEKD